MLVPHIEKGVSFFRKLMGVEKHWSFPDGHFYGDLFGWGAYGNPVAFSMGAYLELDDIKNHQDTHLDVFYDQLGEMLKFLEERYNLQIQWTVDSDYSDILDRYKKITDEKADQGSAISAHIRDQYTKVIDDLAGNNMLRRQRVYLFLTTRVDKDFTSLKDERSKASYIIQMEKGMRERLSSFNSILGEFAKLDILNALEYKVFATHFMSPSYAYKNMGEEEAQYLGSDNLSLMDIAVHSDGVTHEENGICYLHLDGCWNAIIVMEEKPAVVRDGIMWGLCDAVMTRCHITQNVYPVNIQWEIKKEQAEITKLRNKMARNKGDYQQVIDEKSAKINTLRSGFNLPFKIMTVVRVFDHDLEVLKSNAMAVKQAIRQMSGAKYHEANFAGEAISLFSETIVGWTFGSNRHWDIYAELNYLPYMLAVSSTYVGDSKNPEAIYIGNDSNVVGVTTFIGDTPQNSVMLGTSGSGKSVASIDVLAQTELLYYFTLIIEEGLSYGIYTKSLGFEPIIVQPDMDMTLNIFDTNGTPMTKESLSACVGFLCKMATASEDKEVMQELSSLLTKYVQSLYDDAFEDKKSYDPEWYERMSREAFVVDQIKAVNKGYSLLDAFKDLLDLSDDERHVRMSLVEDDELLAFQRDRKTYRQIRDYSFYSFEPNDFPILSELEEKLRFDSEEGDSEELLYKIADRIAQFCAIDGQYGKFFDGVSTFKITGRHVHFELGYIKKSDEVLKEMVGFLIANFARQHIILLPRGLRKRIVFEEVYRFMKIPASRQIVEEAYEQMRKFGCWIISISQQYAQLEKSSICEAIFGNSSQFLLMKQMDQTDVVNIAKRNNLPTNAQYAITQFKKPENLPENDRYSSIMYYRPDSPKGMCGVYRIYALPEIRYIAESNGAKFDTKSKIINMYDDPCVGVIAEVEKEKRQK
jgi:hypothetical protein